MKCLKPLKLVVLEKTRNGEKLFNRLSCFCVFFFLPDSLAGHKKNRTDTKTMTEDGKVAAELSAACLSIG